MRQGTSKDAIEFIFCWPLLLGKQPTPLRIVCFPQWNSFGEKDIIICKLLSIGYSFFRVCFFFFFPFSSRNPTGEDPDPGRPCVCCPSLWGWVHLFCWFTGPCHVNLQVLVCLVSSIPSVSYTLSASSSVGFPDPWGEQFDGDIFFRPECFKVSLVHNVWLWVSVFGPICCRRKSLRMAEQDTDLLPFPESIQAFHWCVFDSIRKALWRMSFLI